MCDALMQITNIVAGWSDSVHILFILMNNVVGNRLQIGTVQDGELLVFLLVKLQFQSILTSLFLSACIVVT